MSYQLLRAQAVQELYELQRILAFVDSRLESIERFLKNFTNQPNETNMNDLESDDESVDTPLVSPFPHSNNDSDDGEVLNELIEYENVGMIRREKAINSFDWDDLAFQCMIGFRKFTYIIEFVVLEDIGEFIQINKAEVVMGRKAYLLEDKQIPSAGVFDEVFSIWKAFGGNTCDLGSFGEEMDKTTNQHQDSSRFKVSKPGDGVTIYTRCRHTSSSDDVTTSLDGVIPHRINSYLEDSTL
ncbi:hypothetical protein Tco_0675712 [Tanacetum coccineum]